MLGRCAAGYEGERECVSCPAGSLQHYHNRSSSFWGVTAPTINRCRACQAARLSHRCAGTSLCTPGRVKLVHSGVTRRQKHKVERKEWKYSPRRGVQFLPLHALPCDRGRDFNQPLQTRCRTSERRSGDFSFFFFFSPPVPNPLIPLISSHIHTLTRKFRLVIRIQSTRLSSLHTPTVCYVGQAGGRSSYGAMMRPIKLFGGDKPPVQWLCLSVCVFLGCACCWWESEKGPFPQGLLILTQMRAHTHTQTNTFTCPISHFALVIHTHA